MSQDDAEAVRWFRLAAAQGEWMAQRRLESTLEEIVERFGEDAVHRAGDPKTTLGADLAANMDFLDKKG